MFEVLKELWGLTLGWVIVAASVVLMWLNKPAKAIALYFWAIICYSVVYVIYNTNYFGDFWDDEIVYLIQTILLVLLCIVPAIKLLFAKKTKGVKYAMILLIVCIALCLLFSIADLGAFWVTPHLVGMGAYVFPALAVVAIGLSNKSIKASAKAKSSEAEAHETETEQKIVSSVSSLSELH